MHIFISRPAAVCSTDAVAPEPTADESLTLAVVDDFEAKYLQCASAEFAFVSAVVVRIVSGFDVAVGVGWLVPMELDCDEFEAENSHM